MRLESEGIRSLMTGSLLSFLATLTSYLWFVDLLEKQRTFAMILSAELVTFSMLIYVATKPTFEDLRRSWILIGCAIVALLLLFAVTVQ